MRVIFAGTPQFAVPALGALLDSRIDVALILTQPDRPTGRGQQLQPSAVKRVALEHSLPVFQPATLRDPESLARLQALSADVMVVVAYGLILPPAVLAATRLGALNIHASLLPRWRGAAPIQRAILAGDAETGVAIMQMEAGLDTGPVWLEERLPILEDDTAGSLADKLSAAGARLLIDALQRELESGRSPTPQPSTGLTYAHKIEKAEAELHWERPAVELGRAVRAFNPVPGASTHLSETLVKVWRARVAQKPNPGATPGTILGTHAEGIEVACGEGVLTLQELQRAGGRRLQAREFVAGGAPRPGEKFGRG